MPDPRRGEVWFCDLAPTRGHEQTGKRPVLIISDEPFNRSAADLVIVLPITSKDKGIVHQVALVPPEGGMKQTSYIKCEDVRSIAKERLSSRWGIVSVGTLAAVEYRLRLLMKL